MLWIKLMASLLIICATSLLGFDLAARLTKRRDSLRNFQVALTMLESEINYAANPLEWALETVGTCVGKEAVGAFFSDISQEMKKGSAMSIKRLFDTKLEAHRAALCLEKDDIHILQAFAATLGVSNKENQLKSISHTKSQLEIQFAAAENACMKSKKMYQSFGVLSGLLISVILF